MQIRPATIADLPGIIRCAESFFEYAGYEKDGMPLNRDDFSNKVAWYIKDPNGVVLLIVNNGYVCGGISGYLTEWDFNHEIKILIEFFYWIDPEYRGSNGIRLLKEYERYGSMLGAHKVVMISPQTHLTDKVESMYQRMGYKRLEGLWIK